MTTSETPDRAVERTPYGLRGTVFWLLNNASRVAQQLTQPRLSETGMRRGHHGILSTLHEFGPAAQADIGRRLGLDPSDMVAILNDLESLGYVKRERDPSDRRRNTVTLTPSGLTTLGRFDAAIEAAQDAVLAAFSPADRDTLIELLERLVRTAGQRLTLANE